MKMGGRRPPLVPDAEVIRALAGLLSETGLSEICLLYTSDAADE